MSGTSVRWAERDIRPYHRKRDLGINESSNLVNPVNPVNPASDNVTNKSKCVIFLVELDAAFAVEVNVLTNKMTRE